jgi:hypothetical protein
VEPDTQQQPQAGDEPADSALDDKERHQTDTKPALLSYFSPLPERSMSFIASASPMPGMPKNAWKKGFSHVRAAQCSTHFSHSAAWASLGMRQSPRGDRLMLPTFGPSGTHERLN